MIVRPLENGRTVSFPYWPGEVFKDLRNLLLSKYTGDIV